MPHVHVGPTLELKLSHSAPNTWHTVSHSKCAKCPALPSLPPKILNFRVSRNSTKFDVVARFRETIPTVKSVLLFEILKNSGFGPKLPFYHFSKN